MISVYTGFPGSGKSLHAVERIYHNVKSQCYVCSNIMLDAYKDNPYYIYHDFLWWQDVANVQQLAEQHISDKYPLLFILDEAQVLFDSRQWSEKGRMPWNIFFSMHRHYKCNFILITQSIDNLDRRIRANVEYRYQHINVKHATRVTHFLFGLFPDFIFLANRFYGSSKECIGSDWIVCRKKYTRLYNTYDRDSLTVSGTASVGRSDGVSQTVTGHSAVDRGC